MAIEDVIARITQSANDKKSEILREAEQEKNKIMSEWQKNAADFYEIERRKAEHDADNEKRSIVLARRLELRKELLSAKQKIIDDALQKAFEKMTKMPEKEYQSFLEKLMKETAAGGEEVLCKKEDQSLLEKVIKSSGKKVTLSKETREISGGFILKNGKIETNVSLETLFETKRNDLEQEVGKLLNVF